MQSSSWTKRLLVSILETAARVQKVMRDELQQRGATVVSVAHRGGVLEGVDGVDNIGQRKG